MIVTLSMCAFGRLLIGSPGRVLSEILCRDAPAVVCRSIHFAEGVDVRAKVSGKWKNKSPPLRIRVSKGTKWNVLVSRTLAAIVR